ncbi:MAG: cation diffusion facilitator family transporter [Prolixibacteraceae bacterium]|jgi:cobalt-zinc-cadmium efflux system protein|nr:cation diffusion facilitator family transporter [Prolixibacteraceae bacterium]
MGNNHAKSSVTKNANLAFVVGIVLNLAYVLLQIIVGLKVNSLSLLSDAGHNFLDVSGLAFSLMAFKLTKSKATERLTYGYKKSSILIALLNTVILLLSIGAIGYEALLRFKDPEPLDGITVAWIALIGIFINGISAFLFFSEKDQDINIRSAFLHLLSDAVISLGLVAGGVIIYFTHYYWVDSLLSTLICLVILWSTWNLLKSSLHLSMDGVPEDIDLDEIKTMIGSMKGVENLHHIHVWAISTKENALTGHLVVAENLSADEVGRIRHTIRIKLSELNIAHATLEIETANDLCDNEHCDS